jgi:putative sterol carrier protein
MINGELKPSAAFMTGKLKIKGNMSLGMKLGNLYFKI